jgi:hypothetical protein
MRAAFYDSGTRSNILRWCKEDEGPGDRASGPDFAHCLVGGVMEGCSFDKLVQFLDKRLNLDEKLEILGHLDGCSICREAIYFICRDRDEALFIRRKIAA